MSSVRVVAGILVAAMLLTWSVWTPTTRVPLGGGAFERDDTATVMDSLRPDEARREIAPQRKMIDRYGNEIERAISDYRVDYRGDIYERHSPDTAVPRLGPPST